MKRSAISTTAPLLALLLAGCASQPASSTKTVGVSGSRDAVSATVEVQGLRDELARLRNEIELQRNQLDKLTQRQRQLYDDLDYRLRRQERSMTGNVALQPSPPGYTGGNVQGSTATPGFTGSNVQGTTGSNVPGYAGSDTGSGFVRTDPDTTTFGGTPGVQGTMPPSAGTAGQLPGSTTVAAIPQLPPQQAALATPEEQAAYDDAFNQLKQSRYEESVAAFRQLLVAYPYGALADDAQYWIGEAMYVTREFPRALSAFQAVVERYPESPRVAEAMLKLGYIQYEVGQKEDARRTLTEVVTRFPGSRVAISAQTRLRKLQDETGG